MTNVVRSMRVLLRHWRTSGLIVLSIALAVAVNCTIVSLLEALIHPELDMPAPDQLYWVNLYGDRANVMTQARSDSILLSHSAGFALTAWRRNDKNAVVLEHGDSFTPVTSVKVAANFFDVAEIRPLAGRVLDARDIGAQPPSV